MCEEKTKKYKKKKKNTKYKIQNTKYKIQNTKKYKMPYPQQIACFNFEFLLPCLS